MPPGFHCQFAFCTVRNRIGRQQNSNNYSETNYSWFWVPKSQNPKGLTPRRKRLTLFTWFLIHCKSCQLRSLAANLNKIRRILSIVGGLCHHFYLCRIGGTPAKSVMYRYIIHVYIFHTWKKGKNEGLIVLTHTVSKWVGLILQLRFLPKPQMTWSFVPNCSCHLWESNPEIPGRACS